MKGHFWNFVICGFILGTVYGCITIFYAYCLSPILPGIRELAVQFAIIALLGIQGGLIGLFVWSMVFSVKKLNDYFSSR
jgi:hypothetical protein